MFDFNLFFEMLYGVFLVLWPIFKVIWPALLIVVLIRIMLRR